MLKSCLNNMRLTPQFRGVRVPSSLNNNLFLSNQFKNNFNMANTLIQRYASTETRKPLRNNSAVFIESREVDHTDLEKQDLLTRRQIELSKEKVLMKKLKPTSPGIRWWRRPIYPYLWKGKPHKPLTIKRISQSGRNHSGKITVRHRGGGVQRRIRMIDYQRSEPGIQTVQRIEYDPNRTAHIALVKHNDTGVLSYIVACEGLRAGDEVEMLRFQERVTVYQFI
ncbi:unnamed protein product [[Candida] boidinii]|nr:unnamed protein product [[Candida] boidinii]